MRNKILKVVSIIAMLAVPLPLMSMFDVLGTEQFLPLKYLIYFCFCWIPMLGGYFLELFKRKQTKPKKIALSKVLLFIGAVMAEVLALVGLSVADRLTKANTFTFMAVLSFLPSVLMWYLAGRKLTEKSFTDTFTFQWLAVYAVESFLCYIFASMQQAMMDYNQTFSDALSACRSLIAFMLIIMAMITVLLINQSNIETQINRRKNINLIVPRGLRSHNARMIIIVCSVILLLMLCKDIIVDFLNWIATTTLKIIDALLMNIEMYSAPIPDDETPDGLGELLSVGGSGFDVTLYLALIVAVVLIIVFRKKIAEFFRYMAGRLFKRLSAQDEKTYEDEGYTDYYETISIRKERIEQTTPTELLKSYKKEQNPTEKYRIGYRLFLMWMAKRSKKLSPAYTVEQQTDEASRLYMGKCDIEKISETYSDIRYNDKTADNGGEMDRLIEELYK
ncbi:MAG: hypothetical protein J1E39_07620 [Eubacterium sp.]|nr:hypothetical protein [Eubacterium sp.]